MNATTKLRFIKLLHTAIWVLFNIVIFYIVYAVIADQIDYRLWFCYSLIVAEGLVLLLFKWNCPLTVWARRYSDSTRHNFDIYLPEWLAKHNKLIYSSIVFFSLFVLGYRLLV